MRQIARQDYSRRPHFAGVIEFGREPEREPDQPRRLAPLADRLDLARRVMRRNPQDMREQRPPPRPIRPIIYDERTGEPAAADKAAERPRPELHPVALQRREEFRLAKIPLRAHQSSPHARAQSSSHRASNPSPA